MVCHGIYVVCYRAETNRWNMFELLVFASRILVVRRVQLVFNDCCLCESSLGWSELKLGSPFYLCVL